MGWTICKLVDIGENGGSFVFNHLVNVENIHILTLLMERILTPYGSLLILGTLLVMVGH